MRRVPPLATIVALALALACGSRAKPEPDRVTPRARSSAKGGDRVESRKDDCFSDLANVPPEHEAIVKALCSELAHAGGAGASIAIAEHGRIVFAGGVGERCVGTGDPPDGDTRYGIGSITKTLTALATVRADAAGTLDLDAPIGTVVPELTAEGHHAAVTLRSLLQHTGGIPELPPWKVGGPRFDWLGHLASKPGWTPPGELWSYSNTGYFVVGEALQRATKQPYEMTIRELVLLPDELQHVTFDAKLAVEQRAACGHRRDRGKWAAVPLDVDLDAENHRLVAPAGGALASAQDLVHLAGVLSKNEGLRAQLRETDRTDGERWGLGIRVERDDPAMGPLYGHSGNTGTFAADILWDEHSRGLAILTNVPVQLRGTLDMAKRTFFEREPIPAPPPRSPNEFAGTYEVSGWTQPVEIRADGKNLRVDVPQLGTEGLLLRPVSGASFQGVWPGTLEPVRVDFTRWPEGDDAGLHVRSGLFVGRRR